MGKYCNISDFEEIASNVLLSSKCKIKLPNNIIKCCKMQKYIIQTFYIITLLWVLLFNFDMRTLAIDYLHGSYTDIF